VKRVLEPELMDEADQAKAYAEADFSEPNTIFLRCFSELHPEPLETVEVVDLGCGPADITLAFARLHPRARVLGLDGSEAMLAFGRRQLAHDPDLAARVRLLCDRLPTSSLQPSSFDVILANSLLHHLHDPGVLWQTLHHCARPGAAVLVMDLRRPANKAELAWLVGEYAGDAPELLRRDFGNSLRAAFTAEEVREQLDQAGLGGLRVDIVSNRHLTVRGELV
jgi:SAM-dependent methyltransferase